MVLSGSGGSQSMKSVMVSADGTGDFKDVDVVTNGPAVRTVDRLLILVLSHVS